METVITIILLIIALPIFSDIALPDSHICKSILENFEWYHRLNKYIEEHLKFFTWLLIITCVAVIYPLCFYWGYSSYKPVTIKASVIPLGFIPAERVDEHANPEYIKYSLCWQIMRNDSLFVIKISKQDSIVYDRGNNKLLRTAAMVNIPNDIEHYEESNFLSKCIFGVFITPTWKELKDNYNLSSNGKKAWIICCMIAGYFGYHQGYKFHSHEINTINIKNRWNEWMQVQPVINDENWWHKLSSDYPYHPSGVIDETHPLGAGIGIVYDIIDDAAIISKVNENSPAQKMGLRIGDKIIAIDGEQLIKDDDLSWFVFSHVRGYKDTFVTLKIQRETNPRNLELEVIREIMPIPVSLYYKTPPSISFNCEY